MQLSIIIVTWNSSATLGACIDAIQKHVTNVKYEILVVDNDSSDKEYLKPYRNQAHVILIENSGNWGFSRANNIGVAQSQGEYLLILNPDVFLISNPFPNLFSILTTHPDIAAIGPMLVEPSGKPQIEGYYYRFPSLLQTLLVRTWLIRFRIANSLAFKYCHALIPATGLVYVDQIPGAFMVMKRSAFPGPHLLNEAFFIWMEDVDFCRQIADSGRKVAVFCDEKAVHLGGASFQLWSNQRKVQTAFTSYATYLRLHHGRARYLLDHLILFTNYSFVLFIVTGKLCFRLKFLELVPSIRGQGKLLLSIFKSALRFKH